jgi:hypothetical protein
MENARFSPTNWDIILGMAGYVAHHTKKNQRLLRLEQQLSRSVHGGAPLEQRLVLADEVRLARIRALRATRATFFPAKTVSQSNRGDALEAKIASLERMTGEDILIEFTNDVGQR